VSHARPRSRVSKLGPRSSVRKLLLYLRRACFSAVPAPRRAVSGGSVSATILPESLCREREEERMHWAASNAARARKKRRRFCFGLLSSGQVRAHGRTPQHSTAQPRFSLRFGARSSCRAFRSRLPSHLQREGRQQGRRGQGKGIKDGPACTDNLADAATHKNILLARSFDPARQASESPVWSRHG